MDDKIKRAGEAVGGIIGSSAQIGLVLGSGLGNIVDDFEDSKTVSFDDIPGFPRATVKGHRGEIVSGRFAGANVVALSGRVHYYEGYSMDEICLPVKVMQYLGVKTLIVTNAAGAVNGEFVPGDIVCISDHINLMGANPLRGSAQFIDLTSAYDKELIKIAQQSAGQEGLDLKHGIYLALSGPSYETPAEIKMARMLGADMVGMSTVPEVITARSLQIRVLGFTMITNMAAGLVKDQELDHGDVIGITTKENSKFSSLIRQTIKNTSELVEK